MNTPKDYWFYIETYVHISEKKDSLLLYNTFTGKALEYSGEACLPLLKLIRRLQAPKNLWIIRLTDRDLKDPVIAEFVRAVRVNFMGDLLDTSFSMGKPVQIVPAVTIRKNARLLKRQGNRSVGENMMKYLSELFLYIESQCRWGCGMCHQAYKQFPCCTAAKAGKGEWEPETVREQMQHLASTSLSNINILGGDILAYPKFEELADILNNIGRWDQQGQVIQKTYVTYYKSVADRGARMTTLDSHSSLVNMLVNFPVDSGKMRDALKLAKSTDVRTTVVFIVQNQSELDAADAMITEMQIQDYRFQPFFNGKNLDFFRQNVFFEKEEILASGPSLRDIYQNSEVNSLNFGRLTVFNNGHIHANANESRLGILGGDSYYDILYKEMYHGKSWRRVRKYAVTCKGCTFQSLCPPLSNYTYAVGQNDLCFKGNQS